MFRYSQYEWLYKSLRDLNGVKVEIEYGLKGSKYESSIASDAIKLLVYSTISNITRSLKIENSVKGVILYVIKNGRKSTVDIKFSNNHYPISSESELYKAILNAQFKLLIDNMDKTSKEANMHFEAYLKNFQIQLDLESNSFFMESGNLRLDAKDKSITATLKYYRLITVPDRGTYYKHVTISAKMK